jgi:hypothetical protein
VNLIDENVPQEECALLRQKGFPVTQIGNGIGRKGMGDDEIIPLLHQLNRPTFFTLDADFFDRRLRHDRYCLVHLDIDDDLVAEYVRRILRHRSLNSKAKRMGRVVRADADGLSVWRRGQRTEDLPWN